MSTSSEHSWLTKFTLYHLVIIDLIEQISRVVRPSLHFIHLLYLAFSGAEL